VAWVDVKAYENTNPDKIAATGGEQNLKVTTSATNFWYYYLVLISTIG
jgi:hypothetical protein